MMSPINYDEIISDRKLFNEFVYTPLSQALKILEERQKDPILMAKIEKLLNGDIPEVLKNNKCGVLSRHIATPNHESRMFINISKENNLTPVFFEYHDDKFTSNNEFKHSLGQIRLQKEIDCNGDDCSERITIVDFNLFNGKKLKDVVTLWLEPLTIFHKNLFRQYGFKENDYHLYDASEWFKNNGGRAIDYYTNYFILFSGFGILFENFLTTENEDGDFTRNIVLPAINKSMNITGVKPLIVPLGPLDVENESFWFHHLPIIKKIIS